MARLAKQYYRKADGTKEINCYHIMISKKVLNDANLSPEDNFKIKTENKKIIIERQ